jgi:hypothetical protein
MREMRTMIAANSEQIAHCPASVKHLCKRVHISNCHQNKKKDKNGKGKEKKKKEEIKRKSPHLKQYQNKKRGTGNGKKKKGAYQPNSASLTQSNRELS